MDFQMLANMEIKMWVIQIVQMNKIWVMNYKRKALLMQDWATNHVREILLIRKTKLKSIG